MSSDVRRWSTSVRRRVMVIAPHPDDEIAGAGGVILRHRDAGDPVTVVHVTDGRGSRWGGLTPAAMAARRRDEARASVALQGVSAWEWLGLPEWDWVADRAVGALAGLLDQHSPEVVYAPSRVDFHPEHDRVARTFAAALRGSGVAPAIRIYQVQVPLTRLLVNLIAPVGAVWTRVVAAARAYVSQRRSLDPCLRLKCYAGWSRAFAQPAEVFWEMDAGAYVALHAPPDAPLPQGTFRGLRRFPFSDPLAFLAGRAERRRLRRVVADWRLDM